MSTTPSSLQSVLSSANSGLSDLSAGAGIYGGLQKGGVQGYLSALGSASKLAGNLSGASSLNAGAGGLSDALGIYSGLQEGGVSGYGQSAADASKLAGLLTNNPALSAVGSYIAAPLSLYNFGADWQSGDTGGDALRGAEAGASVGSIVPGIGNLIGGLVGGAAGALSSAFGGGKHDPETDAVKGLISQYQSASASDPTAAQAGLQGLSPQQSFEALAGIFDAKNNTPGHSQPIEQVFGRMQEGAFLDDIAQQINQGYTSGTVKPGESASDIYSSVINPWITQQTNGQGILGPANGEGGVVSGAIQDLIGAYTNGQLTNTTPIGISGQQDSQLPAYLGIGAQQGLGIQGTSAAPSQVAQGAPNQLTPNTQPSTQAINHALQPRAVAARGGLMRKKLAHYDDGGDVDLSDLLSYTGNLDLGYSDPVSGSAADTGTLGGGSVGAPSLGDIGSPGTGLNLNSSIGSTSGGGLSGLLQSLGLSASTASTLASLGVTAASLAPIIGALTGSTGKGATQPALPSQYTGALAPVSTPPMNRTANPNMQTMSPAQWLHYGEMPEQQFYQNNQLPTTATSPQGAAAPATAASPQSLPPGLLAALMQSQGQGAAATSPAAPQQQVQPMPAYSGAPGGIGSSPIMRAHGGAAYMSQSPYSSAVAGHARGPGDGTSDDINAKLSDGEYVMDAPTVSILGNGSNEAGARALDTMRQNIRKHAGQKLVKGRQPMHAKAPEQYMDAE